MKKILLRIFTLLILLSSMLQPLSAAAVTPVEVDRQCSLTLEYSKDGVGFSDLQIRIHRIARMEADGCINLLGPYAGFPVKIHGITTQKEWRDTANTLAAYISANAVAPYREALTDSEGKVCFDSLETGVYLVMGITVENELGTYRFENFCQFLPVPAGEEGHNYQVSAKPKSSFEPKPEEPEYKQYQVVKLWKDSGYTNRRPQSVTVDILKNGTVQETVQLNPQNNWSYSWAAPEDGAVWTVVEKDVSDAYTVVISSTLTGFTITNTHVTPGEDPPKTGDTFVLRPWVTAMSVSGMMLMAMGFLHKRKRR